MTDKVVVVTGGASGLGLESARRFAAEGARVAICDLASSALAAAAEAVEGEGGEALAVEMDVTSEASVAAGIAAVNEGMGGVDGLFACAGVSGEGRAAELSLADWSRVMAVNLTGVWLSMRAVLPLMVERGGGSIIAMGSIAATHGVPNSPAYCASKGGVVALSRQVAVDYATSKVRVNSICPGTIRTALVEEAFRRRNPEDPEAAIAEREQSVPLGRLGLPADVASLALFLLSDEAAWITGAAYPVDGGMGAGLDPPAR